MTYCRPVLAEQEGPLLPLTIVEFACANCSLSFESILQQLHPLRLLKPASATTKRLLALTQDLPELNNCVHAAVQKRH